MKKILGNMNEVRLIGFLVIVTLAIGVIGIFALPMVNSEDKSGDTVQSYTATLHSDGTLDETFVYNIISHDTKFLFRSWEEAAVPSDSGYPSDLVHLEVTSITSPPGTTAYLKDDQGTVKIYSGTDDNTINRLAYPDEVGAFNPNCYSPGTYTVNYKYRLYFPVDSDGNYDHLNIKFASQHIAYSNVKITLKSVDKTTAIYPHPPSLHLTMSGTDAVITGSSNENELLEVEMLAPSESSPWPSFIINPERDTRALTESANQAYNTQYWSAYTVNILSKLLVLILPFALLVIWFRYGREEDTIIPTYLSTMPNPERKPWAVNLAFNGAVDDFDENGFYATLLDLDQRDKIKIETRPQGVKIKIIEAKVDDAYEQSVIDFLSRFSGNNSTDPSNPVMTPVGDVPPPGMTFDTDTLKNYASHLNGGGIDPKALDAQRLLLGLTNSRVNRSSKQPLKLPGREILIFAAFLVAGNLLEIFIIGIEFPTSLLFGSFLGVWGYGFIGGIARSILSSTDSSANAQVVADKKWEWAAMLDKLYIGGKARILRLFILPAVLLVASVIIFFSAPIVSYLAVASAELGLILLAQVLLAYSFPDPLFGRWRDGRYKEKLEWDAFRNSLSDLSQMSKYSTADLSMWGSWLVYGTALGVGDKVAQAMSQFNIKFNAAPMVMLAPTHFRPIIHARAPVTYSSGGARGGGHRGGGGRGGGGGHGGGGGRGGGGGGRR